MACRILIKQGVVEEKSRLSDGRGVGYKCTLTKVARIVIHLDKLAKRLLVLLRTNLNGLTALELDPEILYQRTVAAKGTGGVNDTLCLTLHRGGKYLLGRNVGVVINAGALCILTATHEDTLGDKTYHKVGAVGCLVLKLADTK